MSKYILALFFLICLSGCASLSTPMFVPTGNPVSDVFVNSMIGEGIASTGRGFMQELLAELQGNFNRWQDARARSRGECPNPVYDPVARLRFCGHWD